MATTSKEIKNEYKYCKSKSTCCIVIWNIDFNFSKILKLFCCSIFNYCWTFRNGNTSLTTSTSIFPHSFLIQSSYIQLMKRGILISLILAFISIFLLFFLFAFFIFSSTYCIGGFMDYSRGAYCNSFISTSLMIFTLALVILAFSLIGFLISFFPKRKRKSGIN